MAIDRSSRVELQHRGYTIVAVVLKGQPTASISREDASATKDLPAKKERFLGDTVPKAIDAARAWIDAKHQSSAAQRRRPNVGTVQEYEDAFRVKELEDYELKMLRAHAAAGILTTTELAKATGWPKYSSANVHYGNLGKKIAELIGLELKPRKNGTLIGITALATGLDEADASSRHFRWEIHDEVKEALHRLRLLQVGATSR